MSLNIAMATSSGRLSPPAPVLRTGGQVGLATVLGGASAAGAATWHSRRRGEPKSVPVQPWRAVRVPPARMTPVARLVHPPPLHCHDATPAMSSGGERGVLSPRRHSRVPGLYGCVRVPLGARDIRHLCGSSHGCGAACDSLRHSRHPGEGRTLLRSPLANSCTAYAPCQRPQMPPTYPGYAFASRRPHATPWNPHSRHCCCVGLRGARTQLCPAVRLEPRGAR
jgi:hypothetical protein